MGKDPAFLWYPGDWLGGTLGMTFEEKGAYIDLLMLQFNRGHMEGHMAGQVVGQIWDKIKSKFIQDENGLWYNVRLELEITKRKTFIDSRKNNLTGKNQYTKPSGHMDGHTTSHMEDENSISLKGGVGEKKEQTWKTDFAIYAKECREAYKRFTDDDSKMKLQKELNPGIDVEKSIQKGYANYWSQEVGWKNKKSKKTKSINWESTIINSIANTLNKIYLPRSN